MEIFKSDSLLEEDATAGHCPGFSEVDSDLDPTMEDDGSVDMTEEEDWQQPLYDFVRGSDSSVRYGYTFTIIVRYGYPSTMRYENAF